ncbi:MAG: hypothetical protein RR540_06175 [Oscillospiraceae bacterium]
MSKFKENSLIFAIGGGLYSLIEIIWRGYTHWSMAITGGICFVLMYKLDTSLPENKLWKKCILGSVVITSAEFFVGLIVNVWLKWKVWDYSNIPTNIFGQICLPFSVLWFWISLPAVFFSYYLKNKFFTNNKEFAN